MNDLAPAADTTLADSIRQHPRYAYCLDDVRHKLRANLRLVFKSYDMGPRVEGLLQVIYADFRTSEGGPQFLTNLQMETLVGGRNSIFDRLQNGTGLHPLDRFDRQEIANSVVGRFPNATASDVLFLFESDLKTLPEWLPILDKIEAFVAENNDVQEAVSAAENYYSWST